jgi:hypothetical protein
MLGPFPVILIAVVLYNLAVFGGAAAGQHDTAIVLGLGFVIPLFSGDGWKVTVGDLFVTLALGLLFIEVVKATRSSNKSVLNHALSTLVFVGALTEFLVLKGFGTSVFFLITAMCLFDVIAGYTISIVAARRDRNFEDPGYGHDDHP